jgi:hypothetical protein
MNNELARTLYTQAGRTADALSKVGKIAATDRNVVWAKLVAKDFARHKLQVPKAVLEQAGPTAARSSTSAGAGAAATASATAGQAAAGVLRGGAPIAVLLFLAEAAYIAYRYNNGEIDLAEAGRRTMESAATNGGGLGGAVAGAAVGTAICPGIGTAIGTIVGGLSGAATCSRSIRLFTR